MGGWRELVGHPHPDAPHRVGGNDTPSCPGSSSFRISSWSIFCTLLRATKTVATFMPRAAAASAPDCPCSAVRSNASHVRGATRSRTRAIASSSNSRSNSSSSRRTRSSRLDRLEQLDGLAAAGRDDRLAAGPGVAPGVAGDGLQPGPEALRRVVVERPHLLRQLEQDALRHVLGVGFLEVPLPAPGVDLAAVALGELDPGGLVRAGPAGAWPAGWRWSASPRSGSSAIPSKLLYFLGLDHRRQAQIEHVQPATGKIGVRLVRSRRSQPYCLSSRKRELPRNQNIRAEGFTMKRFLAYTVVAAVALTATAAPVLSGHGSQGRGSPTGHGQTARGGHSGQRQSSPSRGSPAGQGQTVPCMHIAVKGKPLPLMAATLGAGPTVRSGHNGQRQATPAHGGNAGRGPTVRGGHNGQRQAGPAHGNPGGHGPTVRGGHNRPRQAGHGQGGRGPGGQGGIGRAGNGYYYSGRGHQNWTHYYWYPRYGCNFYWDPWTELLLLLVRP